MVFNYLNYRKHPEQPDKMVFYYRYADVFEAMLRICREKEIHTEQQTDADGTFYVIVSQQQFDQASDCNNSALLKHKKPIISDAGLRWFLVGIFLLALAIAVVSYIVTEYFTPQEQGEPVKKTSLSFPSYYTAPELELIFTGLSDLQLHIRKIHVDLKYSGTDNFMGKDMYGDINHAFLHPQAIEKLQKAWDTLQHLAPGHSFIVYDAVRPRSVQQWMWDSVMQTPRNGVFYVSHPGAGSLHNFGMAVDLTLCGPDGKALDMGTPYDYFDKLAHPEWEAYFLQKGELTPAQVSNRKLLRKVMCLAGFSGIQSEWWHFNACSREYASRHTKILE